VKQNKFATISPRFILFIKVFSEPVIFEGLFRPLAKSTGTKSYSAAKGMLLNNAQRTVLINSNIAELRLLLFSTWMDKWDFPLPPRWYKDAARITCHRSGLPTLWLAGGGDSWTQRCAIVVLAADWSAKKFCHRNRLVLIEHPTITQVRMMNNY